MISISTCVLWCIGTSLIAAAVTWMLSVSLYEPTLEHLERGITTEQAIEDGSPF